MNEDRLIEFVVRNRAQGWKVTIVTHEALHLDESLAASLIERYGSVKFIAEHAQDGKILLGVGHGEFDEHPHPGQDDRKVGECCASLVAHSLDVDRDKLVGQAINYTKQADGGHDVPFGIGNVMKLIHQANPDQPLLAHHWARLGFCALLNDLGTANDFSIQAIATVMVAQKGAAGWKWLKTGLQFKSQEHVSFFGETKTEFEANAKVSLITGPKNRSLTLAVIESDNTLIGRYAKSIYGARADVVVVRNSDGHTQILGNQMTGIFLYKVAMLIRAAECHARGLPVPGTKELTMEDSFEGDPWHILPNGCVLLNGSVTNRRVSASMLVDVPALVQLVKLGVDPESCVEARCNALRAKKSYDADPTRGHAAR